MKLEGEHRFDASRDEVWRALQDPRMLANALPGVRRLDPSGPDSYDIALTLGVGAVKGSYDGTFSLSDKREAESCTVRASASGSPGSISTTAAMQLREAEDRGTVLTYQAEAKVTGPLAGVGQRIVAAAARRTTNEFLSAIDRELTSGVSGALPAGAAADGSAGPAARAESAALRAGAGTATGAGRDVKLLGAGIAAGFLLAIVGVLVGRRDADR